MEPNQGQKAAWNGTESVHYVDHADRYDRQLEPVTVALLDRAAIGPEHAVLDVGCGSGAMSLVAARSAHRVVGVDISEPLVALAVDRARHAGLVNTEFVVADAQTHVFDAPSFDVVISQFGLMFFDDPVAAFTNLRAAMTTGGRIVFSTWRRLEDNDWLAPVVRAVAEHAEIPDLGGLAAGGGMFALEDRSETEELLERTGFVDVAIESVSPEVLIGGGGSIDDSASFLLGMGIVRGLLSRLDDSQREQAAQEIRDELAERHEPGVGNRLGVATWLVSAHA